jgi:acid phosphatase type 7
MKNKTISLVASLILLVGSAHNMVAHDDARELIPFDATWWFDDTDTNPGTDWIKPNFDHSSWSRGEALLGYDTTSTRHQRWPEPGLQTALRENLVSYYFRKEFDYQGPLSNVRLKIEQIIDDGAVYYLNGIEIGRSELMPEGRITHTTRTTSFTNPGNEHTPIEVVNPPLVEGRNVLAVSVHNVGPTSSDICFGARVSIANATATPRALYLTWQRDPTSTMTIHWHTEGDQGPAYLLFHPTADATPERLKAETHPMPFSQRLVHTVEITGLDPDTAYAFQIANVTDGLASPRYQFRTMPSKLNRPLRIVAGGDQLHRKEWVLETNRQAVRLDPDFIIWGGDLAYADGLAERVERWYQFFDAIVETLITPDNRAIPILFGIGNHEIVGGYYWGNNRGMDAYEDSDAFREMIAPYYYNLFAWPGHPGYGTLDFGDYLSIIMLDTDHSGPIEGKQTDWLKEQLDSRQHVTHVLPVYHVPAFPSFRGYDNQITNTRVREHWVPLFEQFDVEIAFENHDHTYKRTFPILNEAKAEGGIIYVGDGAWGVGVRQPDMSRWYLERGEALRHLILLSIHGRYRDFKVIDSEGNLIDHFFDYAGQRAGLR